MSRIDIYRQPPIEVKWIMNDNKFTAEYKGRSLIVSQGGFCWMWEIFKDSILVDAAYYHPALPDSELDAKVKCQRALNNIKPDK